MDKRPIGIFDSGIGGLSAAGVLERILPNENLIYFGDSANMPYGVRSVENIRQLALNNGEFLAGMGVKAVLVACGTVSSTAMDVLERNFDIPFFGVVEPACALAAESGAGRIAVIATRASVESGVFDKRLHELRPEARVFSKACLKLVPTVERGHFTRGDAEAEAAVAEELAEVRDFGPELLILGCTHFPLLSQVIEDYMGAGTRLLSVSEAAAHSLKSWLTQNNALNPSGGERRCFTSGDAREFEANAEKFLGHTVVVEQRRQE